MQAVLCTNWNIDKKNQRFLNDSILEQVGKYKFLGIIIDCRLTWKIHREKVSSILSRNLGIIRKLQVAVLNILFTIYYRLSQYAILTWGNTCKSFLDKLFVAQKKSLRLINNLNYRDHSVPLFLKYNTLTVYHLYKYQLGLLMYKFEKNVLLMSIKSLSIKNKDIHG